MNETNTRPRNKSMYLWSVGVYVKGGKNMPLNQKIFISGHEENWTSISKTMTSEPPSYHTKIKSKQFKDLTVRN